MAYLGSTPTTQSFIAGTDTFSGTGAQVAFTLTRAVNSVNDILVVVNNVDQQPSAYSVSGTTLTFSAAPSSGTNNVYVRYLSTTLQSITVPGGTTVDGTFGVSSSSSSDALRITNTGTGNSFVVEDTDNPDSTPYVINSSGTTITGYTTAIDSVSPHNGTAGFTPKVQNHSALQATAANMIGFWNTFPTQGGAFQFVRSRSSTIGAFSPVVNNDVLGFLQFLGDDGTGFIRAADVTAAVDGTPSTGVMPGRLVFRTTPSGSSTPVERMRIDSAGNIGIGTTSPAAVGGTSLQISDRSTLSQLTINNSTFLTNNLAYDGTNWRYIVTGFGSIYAVGSLGTTSVFRAASGTAGAIATLGESTRTDASGGFYFDSGYGSAAAAYGCRAWVNFNGTGTVAIRNSGNVSSITDNGVGIYTVNFTTAMVDANYSLGTFACNGTNTTPAGLITHGNNFAPTVNNVQVKTVLSAAYTAMDSPNVSVNIFR